VRIGIFGGAFDPVQTAHLLVARDAQEKLKLDRVLFMITPRPPHKQCAASYADRLAMLRRAVRPHAGFAVCALEQARAGKSYTIDSLAELRQKYPGDELLLLMGTDQFAVLDTWKQPERLPDYARLVVLFRPGTRPALRPTRRSSAQFLEVRQIDLSSSEIRRRIGLGRDIRGMVPDTVLKIIVRKRLYQPTKKGS
jgi:nicotinate-nucleotide adenylyltransferase